jgi:DNA-binding Xre family transcriptional regulator
LANACGLPLSDIGDIEQTRVNVTLASLEALTVGLECAPVDLLTPLRRPPSTDAT